jgi:NAD(P)-dependent dehydrogenase (short-subunit alcohol dehydrogenase family)
VAIVTRSGGGIASAVSIALIQRGFTVCGVDIDAAGLASLCQRLLSPQFLPFVCDVSNANSVCQTLADITRNCGSSDVPVNHAALLRDGVPVGVGRGGIHKLSTALWDEVMNVNLKGTFLMVREVVAGSFVIDGEHAGTRSMEVDGGWT